jgi:hypothetical protein
MDWAIVRRMCWDPWSWEVNKVKLVFWDLSFIIARQDLILFSLIPRKMWPAVCFKSVQPGWRLWEQKGTETFQTWMASLTAHRPHRPHRQEKNLEDQCLPTFLRGMGLPTFCEESASVWADMKISSLRDVWLGKAKSGDRFCAGPLPIKFRHSILEA